MKFVKKGIVMKNKIFSSVISLLMIILLLQPVYSVLAVSTTWNGGTAVPTLSGGYYQINTAEKLAWFARQVNSGSASIKAKLTDDIMLNANGSFSREWTPIGTVNNPFSGEFDGGGHYISGVYINTQREYNGLFGYVYTDRPVVDDEDDSTEEIFVANPPVMIHDTEVKNSQITGLENTGGVCGYIHYGIIKNCSYSGIVTSDGNSIGGVCGKAAVFSRVVQCRSDGSVTGVIRTGGIVGFAESNAQISECCCEAAVRSNASVNGNAGGIVGALSAGVLKGCYFMGSVTGPKRIGGAIGFNSYSSVVSCYVTGAVSSTTGASEYVNSVAGYSMGGTYTNCYFCEAETGAGDPNGTARTVEDMKKFSFVRELNENANAFSYDYLMINNGLPVLAFMLETSVWSGGAEEPEMDSSGYYLIKSADNLAWFARLVNGTLSDVGRNTSAKAKVTENLLLNIFITDDDTLTNRWTPIGSEAYPFTGTFNGNGYNIAGVYVNGAKNQGLFGYVGTGGNVSGVVMLDGEISGTENVGAVAGYNKGTISLSCNDGVVNGRKAVGGICGYNVGTIQTSYNAGTVECTYDGGSQIGGICGYNTRASIKQCFNNGLVTGKADSNYYGGICGFNSGDGIYNCYNAGEILGGFYVGGLVGYNSTGTVKYCLNHGIVNTLNAVNSNVNNFIGYNYGTCTTQYSYFDSAIENSVMSNTDSGVSAKTTAELTGGSASYTLGLQSGSWSNRYDDSYFRYYPQIYQLCYSGIAKYVNDSLESVRVVKDDFSVRLKIDGEAETYYPDFTSAFNALKGRSGTAVPIRNMTLSQTVSVETRVALHGEGHSVTVTRAAGFTDSLFNVTDTGTLILGDSRDGSDDNILLIIDGNTSVSGADSVITLGERACLNTYPGWKITGAKAAAKGAAVYMDSDASFNMHGGIITENSTTLDGGAVYNDMGTFNMDGGTISANTSTASTSKAGAVYINSGVMNFSGGAVKNNYGKAYGGGIYVSGADSEAIISSNALIKGNYANAGGGILINSGTVNMTGGEISENFAYKKHGSTAVTGGGGGVAVNTSGKFAMSGGVIKGNYVYDNAGAGFGVTVFGTFEMSADALISNNDVFVGRNRTVAVTGRLNADGTAAVITPATYAVTTVVLSGEFMGPDSTKFEVTPSGTTLWYVNSAGYLMNTPIENVASLSKFGAYAVDYVSVAQAVNAVSAGETGIITIIADNTINETIKVYGDVTILSETDSTFTSMRAGSFKGAMFDVQPGGTLTFGFTEAEKTGEDVSADKNEEFTADSVGGEYILDGGYARNQSTGTSMITVKSGGTLVTYDDFTMANGYSTSSGCISVSGVMNMYGGTFRNNTALNGGAINVAATGTLNLLGGCITGNNVTASTGHGKAVYCAGSISRLNNVYEYYQNDEVVATRNTYVNITPDNDVYLISGKQLNLGSTVTDVLLSDTAAPPESVTVAAPEMVLSAPVYYEGMQILAGDDTALHYSEFSVSDSGYYIMPGGTIGYRLLTAVTDSGLRIDRTADLISGFDISKPVSYYRTMFINPGNIEFKDINGNIMADDARLTTGSSVSLKSADGTQVYDTAVVVIYGDVDCDGFTDAMDAQYIYCVSQNLFAAGVLTAAQLRAADLDGNGADASDAQYVESCGIKFNTVDQNT